MIEKTILSMLRWWTRFLLVGLLGLGALASAWPPSWCIAQQQFSIPADRTPAPTAASA